MQTHTKSCQDEGGTQVLLAEVRCGEEMYLSLLGLTPAMNYFTCPIEIREQEVKVTGTKEGCSMQNRGRLSTGCSPSQ